MIRGAFGRALKRMVCSRAHGNCSACDLSGICPYPTIFEPTGRSQGPANPPAPFTIEWEEAALRNRREDSPWSFDLILIGPTRSLAGMAVSAVTRSAEEGFRHPPVPHSLTRVQVVPEDPADPPDEDRLRIHLLTPLRLRRENRLVGQLNFEEFVRATLRRCRLLFPSFAQTLPTEGARQVETVDQDLRWRDWTRYSGRQGTAMKLGGLVGWIDFRGPWKEYWPLLRVAQRIHVGKAASFGLGRIRLGTGGSDGDL